MAEIVGLRYVCLTMLSIVRVREVESYCMVAMSKLLGADIPLGLGEADMLKKENIPVVVILLVFVGTANAMQDPVITGEDSVVSDVSDMQDNVSSQEVSLSDVDQTCQFCRSLKCSASSCGCSKWNVAVEGLVMRRDQMDSVPLVIDSANGNVLLGDDLNMGSQDGFHLSVSRQMNHCNDLEFEYYGVEDMGATTHIDTPGAQMTVYGSSFGTAPLDVTYATDLYNFEMNWRRRLRCQRFKSLLGFRVMELREDLSTLDAVSPPQLFQGDVNNHLMGGHFGIEGILFKQCRLVFEGGMKIGVYHNDADFFASFPQAGPAAVFQANEEHTAFTGDLWLDMNYWLTDHLAFRLGYQAMWMEGVALLPEQLDDLAVPILGDLDMAGSPLYQAITFGTQLRW